MRADKLIVVVSLLLPATFSGCGPNAPATGGTVTSASQGAQSEGVTRQTPTPQPSATPTPALTLPPGNAVIATRLGAGNFEVDLMRASVTGDILTVELRYRNLGGPYKYKTINFRVEEVNIIDDATSRRYGVLKDQSGLYMASPLSQFRGYRNEILINMSPEEYYVAWFKFPAPPAQSQTVSINIPEVAPFDGIRIQR